MLIKYASMTMQGKREYQQDSIGCYSSDTGGIACVCDGMGGMTGGDIASKAALYTFLEDYQHKNGQEEIHDFLESEVFRLDDKVFRLRDIQGRWLNAGTTLAAVVIEGREMHWLSIGDSKIYIFRDKDMVCVTKEHNYRMELERLLSQGDITEDTYKTELCRGELLLSYLGMGNISLWDCNAHPFLLRPGDKVLLCSDGVYRSIEEEEIKKIIYEYNECIEISVKQIEKTIRSKDISNQDNASLILIKCTDMEE